MILSLQLISEFVTAAGIGTLERDGILGITKRENISRYIADFITGLSNRTSGMAAPLTATAKIVFERQS